MSAFQELVRVAPAKVNLWLRVLGKRPDGYHELSTVMMALELADVLHGRLTDEDDIQLEVSGPQATADIPSDESNLVWRAMDAVRRRAAAAGHAVRGLRVRLEKNIPSQAGLGGGSSDAAAALQLAEALLGFDAGQTWRRETLAQLGADCTFFHDVGPSAIALCEGIGERVTLWPGNSPAWWVVILVPEVLSPTVSLFAALGAQPLEPGNRPRAPHFRELNLSAVRDSLSTDLEAPALEATPELAAWRRLLDGGGSQHFRLSGSGSSFFGLFDRKDDASSECDRLVALSAAEGLPVRASFVTNPA